MEKNTSSSKENNNTVVEEELQQDVVNEATSETNDAPENEVNIEELQQELQDAQNSSKENYEKMLRIQAEMDNLRKRNAKDLENAHKFALDSFAKSLLEVADSITMGIKTASEENTTLESIKEGMELTNKVFLDTLEKNGISQVNPKSGAEGDKFNPETQEAITMIPSEEVSSGVVVDVVQVGFSLNDRVIRPAMVVVAQ